MTVVNPIDLETITLLKGGHDDKTPGEWCFMEAVAYIAGEKWSANPKCACPVITSFMIGWNDRIGDDETRTRLLAPLLLKVLGTRSTVFVEMERRWMLADWVVRVVSPIWLRAAGLDADAAMLEALDPIVDRATADAVYAATRPIRDRAWQRRTELRQKLRSAVAVAADADAADAAAVAAVRSQVWNETYDKVYRETYDRLLPICRERFAGTIAIVEQSAVELVEHLCEMGKTAA